MKDEIKAIQILSREGYLDIVKSLPCDATKLCEKFKLSKMPINRRLNELESVGIVVRERGIGNVKGKVNITNFGKKILEKFK